MINTVATLAVATAWGSMLFFVVAIAPSVFRFLEPAVAGRFIRRLFPIYYLTLLLICAVATAFLIPALPDAWLEFALLALVTVGFALARQWLMPTINRFSDAMQAGDKASGAKFQRWHMASVVLNGVQMLVVLYVLYRLV